jgi:hypothetical protein
MSTQEVLSITRRMGRVRPDCFRKGKEDPFSKKVLAGTRTMRCREFPGTTSVRTTTLVVEIVANRCGLAIVLDKTQRMGYDIRIVDKKLISKVMAELGSRTSKAKAAAARENGKKGGRPRKAKVKR